MPSLTSLAFDQLSRRLYTVYQSITRCSQAWEHLTQTERDAWREVVDIAMDEAFCTTCGDSTICLKCNADISVGRCTFCGEDLICPNCTAAETKDKALSKTP